jgi:hypothetical protein
MSKRPYQRAHVKRFVTKSIYRKIPQNKLQNYVHQRTKSLSCEPLNKLIQTVLSGCLTRHRLLNRTSNYNTNPRT